jgi:signal transduction histidine kinase
MQKVHFYRTQIIILTLFYFVSNGFGQNKNLIKIDSALENGKSKEAFRQLSVLKSDNFSAIDSGYYYYLLAKYFFKNNNDEKAIQHYLLAKDSYQKANQSAKAMDINLDIAFCIHKYKSNENKHQYYLDEYLKYASATRDIHKILKGYVQLASLKINPKEAQESLVYFRKSLLLNRNVNDKKLESKIYNNLSVLFSDVLNKPDSGLYYLKKDLILLESEKVPNQAYICINIMNQASNYRQLHQFQKAIQLLHLASQIPIIEYKNYTKESIHTFLYLNYKDAKNTEKALYHIEIANQYNDSLNVEEQNKVINELDIKYKTKEKQLENLRLKTNIKNKQMLVYTFIGILVIFISLSILVYKNIIKKKRIAEQDRLLKIQELEKILKDQELNDIDLMLESQEKERQNIANELHDNLGSMLATLKLNFQNLKHKKEKINQKEIQLFDKTDALLEEAYQKVRTIAHLKNLGVIGSEGLLVAVNKMAEKMSVLEKLKINVIPFGLNERLENTIEVALFRMIQELCTNSIKHSMATEVNIYLTQGSANEINIIIEDNGKGFDPKTIENKSGIGLKNMEKKVEQMGGTFSIDSIIGKGTTIIIDLPL